MALKMRPTTTTNRIIMADQARPISSKNSNLGGLLLSLKYRLSLLQKSLLTFQVILTIINQTAQALDALEGLRA